MLPARALDDMLPCAAVGRLLPGGRGTYRSKLYSVGRFNVALVLCSRSAHLAQLGVRSVTVEQPYSAQEFHDILLNVKNVFDASPSFMCILSRPDHFIERAIRQYFQLVGDRDILGKPVREAQPERVGQGFVALLDNVFATGTDFVGKDVPVSVE